MHFQIVFHFQLKISILSELIRFSFSKRREEEILKTENKNFEKLLLIEFWFSNVSSVAGHEQLFTSV